MAGDLHEFPPSAQKRWRRQRSDPLALLATASVQGPSRSCLLWEAFLVT